MTNSLLGDLVLVAGARVSGRVVDTDGVPQSGVQFMVQVVEIDRVLAEPFTSGGGFTETTDETGSFAVPGWWSPGTYRFVTSESVDLRVDAPATDVRLIVPRVDPGNLIVGVIEDDLGRRLSGVRFAARDRSAGTRVAGWTFRDGVFRLERDRGAAQDSIAVVFQRAGYLDVEPELAWGTLDARIVLSRGDLVVVRVTDPAGQPVEHYAVRRVDPAHPGRIPPPPPRLEGFGAHADGEMELTGIDDELLRIEPQPSSGLWPSPFLPVATVGRGVCIVPVTLREPVACEVLLLDSRGLPVAGARLELLEEAPGSPVDLSTQALDLLRLVNHSSSAWAIEVQTATTGDDGLAVLLGPVDRDLVLRVHGPSCEPRVVRGRLDPSTPWVVPIETPR